MLRACPQQGPRRVRGRNTSPLLFGTAGRGASVGGGQAADHERRDARDRERRRGRRRRLEPPLVPEEARKYRAIAARLNCLAPDTVDIQYTVKEAARSMSSPTAKDWPKLQWIGRYLLRRQRMIMDFPWQIGGSMVTAYADSDWAGCARSALRAEASYR